MNRINVKNKINKLFFIVCIQGLLGLQQVYAATYYVSPTGIDTNNGTSLSTPVKTIKNALSKARSSGDIVYVMTGTYVETVYIGQSNITLSAYANNNPVIDGTTTLPKSDWKSLMYVEGNNNTIAGFEVKNSNINGVYKGGYCIQVAGHHNTVSKMNVHHAWEQGVVINGDYNIFEDSKVWQTARHNSNNTTGAVPVGWYWGMGISATRNRSAAALIPGITSYTILRRNIVFNNWGEGLSCMEADHCTIEDNIIYDNWTWNLYLTNASNSLVQRNIIYVSSAPAIPTRKNWRSGFFMADEAPAAPPSANNTIINNFIYNAKFGAFSWTAIANTGLKNVLIANNTIVDGSFSTGAGGNPAIVNVNSEIRNNIILGTGSAVPSNSGITFSNNNWAGSVIPVLGKSTTDVVGNPLIARTGVTTPGRLTADYFKILTGSPTIDRATVLTTVPEDFFKLIRGTAPDVGAHEFR